MFGIHACLSNVFFFMRYTHEFMGTSYCRQFNLLLGRNACLGYMRVSQMFFFLCGTLTNLWVRAIAVNSTFFSDETHVWDTHMSLKCFFFMLYTHEFMGMSCCRQFNLLLGRNSCLGYINVSQMFFFFMPYTHEFMGMSCCRQREKSNIWFYS